MVKKKKSITSGIYICGNSLGPNMSAANLECFQHRQSKDAGALHVNRGRFLSTHKSSLRHTAQFSPRAFHQFTLYTCFSLLRDKMSESLTHCNSHKHMKLDETLANVKKRKAASSTRWVVVKACFCEYLFHL